MARPTRNRPTDGELEILRILWDRGPSELGVVQEALEEARGRTVAKTTVATMLKVMLEKNLVRRSEGRRNTRWSARITRRVASRGLVGSLTDAVFDGSAGRLVAHIIEQGQLSASEREEIRRLLDAADERGTSR